MLKSHQPHRQHHHATKHKKNHKNVATKGHQQRTTTKSILSPTRRQHQSFTSSATQLQHNKPQQQQQLDQHIPDDVLFPLPEEYKSHVKKTNQHIFTNPEEYWMNQALQLKWTKPPTKALTTGLESDPDNTDLFVEDPVTKEKHPIFHQWFHDGEFNIIENAVDENIAKGLGERNAFIYEQVYTGKTEYITFNELSKRIDICCNALKRAGLQKGDRALFYMPMVPEFAVMLMSCYRMGIITTNTYGGFSSRELAKRMLAFSPDIIFSASCGVEPNKLVNYQELINGAFDEISRDALGLGVVKYHPPKAGVVYMDRKDFKPLNVAQLRAGQDTTLEDFLLDPTMGAVDTTHVPPTPLPASWTNYVAYTSGSTSQPKAILRDTASLAVMLKHTMQHVYGQKPGEVFLPMSDYAWVGGLFFLLAPLLNQSTSIIFEGKPVLPNDPGLYWRTMAKHKVTGSFVAPTALRAIKAVDPLLEHAQQYKHALQQNGCKLFVAGERCDRSTSTWIDANMEISLIDHYWQSESGAPILCLPRSIAHPDRVRHSMEQFDENPRTVRFGSSGFPVNGYDVGVMGADGKLIDTPQKEGTLVLKLPLPPGFMQGLLQDANNARYKKYFSAYPGYFNLEDSGYFDKDHAITVLGRTDDVFNVSGHRLSTGAIEECCSTHPAIAESTTIPLPDQLKGDVPLIFAVLKKSTTPPDHKKIERELVHLVREQVGPVATPKHVIFVDALPKTRSGKILRSTIKKLLNYLIYVQKHNHEAALEASITNKAPQAPKELSEYLKQFDAGRGVYDKMVPYPVTIDNPQALEVLEQICAGYQGLFDQSLAVEDIEKM